MWSRPDFSKIRGMLEKMRSVPNPGAQVIALSIFSVEFSLWCESSDPRRF
jgi:hypothetical protein